MIYTKEQEQIFFPIVQKIKNIYTKSNKDQILIGLAGPPGVGKTTLTSYLLSHLEDSSILPMDGYHLYSHELNEDPEKAEELWKRRGAPWTFNSKKFLEDVKKLKENKEGNFPSFDHAVGDPIENDIKINKNIKIIIVEGNYLYLDEPNWKDLKDLFDYSFFLSAPREVIRSRIINRHCSLGNTLERATERVDLNDGLNAEIVFASQSRADEIIESI